jgi:predicted transcriptional regulator
LYKFYFPNGIFQQHEKEILQILNHKTIREVFLYILEKKNPTKSEIVNHLNISYSSVSWHIERLIAYNMIIEKRDGKFLRYSLNNNFNNISEIIKLLKNHYSGIWKSWSNRLAEVFLILSNENRKNR